MTEATEQPSGGPVAVDAEHETEMLYRQIHPGFVHETRVTSQAFKPTPKDAQQLSVSRSALTTAPDAFELYTQRRGLASSGVMGVTRGECSALDLPVCPDPLKHPVPDPAHAFVDFRETGTTQTEKKSKKLARAANDRGWIFRPDAGES